MAPSNSERQPVGVCVSGGGIRAAAFGFGALQALQARYGLLKGEHCADHLAAVSGGSYIASAYTLVSSVYAASPDESQQGDRALEPAPPKPPAGRALVAADDPFAPGTPEDGYIRLHSRYMVEELGGLGLVLLFAMLMMWNVATLIGCAVALGVGVGALAGSTANLINFAEASVLVQALLGSGGALLFIGAFFVGFASRWPHKRWITAVLGLIGVVLIPGLLIRANTTAVLHGPEWAGDHRSTLGLVVAGTVAFTAVATAMHRVAPRIAGMGSMARLGSQMITLRLVQGVGLLGVIWPAAWAFRTAAGDDVETVELVTLVGAPILALAYVGSGLFLHLSPHLVYRRLLTRAFSIVRTTAAATPSAESAERPANPRFIRLSDMKPPARGRPDCFPELMICAAANISDKGKTAAGTNAASFVATPSTVCIPSDPAATMPTHLYENILRDSWALKLGRLLGVKRTGRLTLATAVAATGAAVSPAMGKQTRNDLRAMFAALNVRLGVWLPNPMNANIRAGGPLPWFVGLMALVRELFGFHPGSTRLVYVSDGGHYDNLGLVELLRKRCQLVVCIDSSGDKPGRTTALSQALLLAGSELGCRFEGLDLKAFSLTSKRREAPVLEATEILGEVHYYDGSVGQILVVKLGLTARSRPELHEYRVSDGRFPHHSTLNQTFRAERFDAYRALGWDSTSLALDAHAERLDATGIVRRAADAIRSTSDDKNSPPGGRPVRAGRSAAVAWRWWRMR